MLLQCQLLQTLPHPSRDGLPGPVQGQPILCRHQLLVQRPRLRPGSGGHGSEPGLSLVALSGVSLLESWVESVNTIQ